MDKKAELSINMIVVIVLALLCLVIIMYVLFSTSDGFREEISCASQGKRCVEAPNCGDGAASGTGCSDGLVCCPIHLVGR